MYESEGLGGRTPTQCMSSESLINVIKKQTKTTTNINSGSRVYETKKAHVVLHDNIIDHSLPRYVIMVCNHKRCLGSTDIWT